MDFREWILRISANGSYEFPRMDPTKFAAKTVNFELFFDIPFFRIGVDAASYGPNQIKYAFQCGVAGPFHFFPFSGYVL